MTSFLTSVSEEVFGNSTYIYRRVPLGSTGAVFSVPVGSARKADVYVRSENEGDAPGSAVLEVKHNWRNSAEAFSYSSAVTITGEGSVVGTDVAGNYLVGEITTSESSTAATIVVVLRNMES